MKTWKVVPVYKRYCGGAAPANYQPPKEIHKLGDGTFIGESPHLGCFRGRWAQCHKKCLPPDTRIATPRGEVAVSELRVGMPVWSRDPKGARIAATVRAVSRVEVSPGHRIVELRLADGRTVRVSAGHPALGGAGVERLPLGSSYDGSEIVRADLRDYGGDATFDLLPSGPTGIYWANGIPLESTLSPGRGDVHRP